MKHDCKGLCSRRHFLEANAMGIGSVALAWLLKQDNLLAGPVKPDLDPKSFDLLPKKPHFEAKAKAMISLFMIGGPSQLCTVGNGSQVRNSSAYARIATPFCRRLLMHTA